MCISPDTRSCYNSNSISYSHSGYSHICNTSVVFPFKKKKKKKSLRHYSNWSPLTDVAPMVVMGKSSTSGAMMSRGHTREASTGMMVCAPISVLIRKVKLKL